MTPRPVLQSTDLDRRVRIERPAGDGGFKDAGHRGWTPVATVWAQVRDILPSRGERVAEGVTLSARPARIRIRWRAGITSDMRFVVGDRVLQIVAGPAELGRREGLEFVAEEYSPASNG